MPKKRAEPTPSPSARKSQEQLCRGCKERISVGALICIHCHSYQNWRRHLQFSGTILALLVALISVGTAAIPVFRSAVAKDDSDLILSLFSSRDGEIHAIASNGGTRPGAIGAGHLVVNDVFQHPETILVGLARGNAVFVEPGKTTPLTFYPWSRLRALPEGGLRSGKCVLKVATRQFSGINRAHTYDRSCTDFESFIRASLEFQPFP